MFVAAMGMVVGLSKDDEIIANAIVNSNGVLDIAGGGGGGVYVDSARFIWAGILADNTVVDEATGAQAYNVGFMVLCDSGMSGDDLVNKGRLSIQCK